MTRNHVLASIVALLASACAADPDAPGAPPDEDGSGDATEDETADDGSDDESSPCTAATDVVPLDELADSVDDSVADVARDADGTIYFISSRTSTGATIGRRVACGTLEKTWLEMTAPINDIAIATDRTLYMSGYEGGAKEENTAYVYALDLTRADALPVNLVHQPEEVAGMLSPGPDGRMYFLQGWILFSLRVVDAEGVSPKLPIGGGFSSIVAVSAMTDGSLLASGTCSTSPCVAHLDMTGTYPTATATYPVPKRISALHATSDGGYVGVTDGTEQLSRALVHAPSLSAAPSILSSGVKARYAFRAAEDPRDVLEIVTSDAANPIRVVTLPAAPAL